MCTDPGFIPLNYEYDVTRMTRTMESLYNFVGLHQDALLERSVDNQAEFIERKREKTFQMRLPVSHLADFNQTNEHTETFDSKPGFSMTFETKREDVQNIQPSPFEAGLTESAEVLSDNEKQQSYTLKSSFSSKGTPSKSSLPTKSSAEEAPVVLLRSYSPQMKVDRSHRINTS